jgi:hypothetical protein
VGLKSVVMTSLVMAAEKFRDLSQAIDVPLLDATVAAFYGTGSKEEVRFSLFHFKCEGLYNNSTLLQS